MYSTDGAERESISVNNALPPSGLTKQLLLKRGAIAHHARVWSLGKSFQPEKRAHPSWSVTESTISYTALLLFWERKRAPHKQWFSRSGSTVFPVKPNLEHIHTGLLQHISYWITPKVGRNWFYTTAWGLGTQLSTVCWFYYSSKNKLLFLTCCLSSSF